MSNVKQVVGLSVDWRERLALALSVAHFYQSLQDAKERAAEANARETQLRKAVANGGAWSYIQEGQDVASHFAKQLASVAFRLDEAVRAFEAFTGVDIAPFLPRIAELRVLHRAPENAFGMKARALRDRKQHPNHPALLL